MITINEIKVNEKKYLTGQIGKENYSIEATPEAKEKLLDFKRKFNSAQDFTAAQEIMDNALDSIKAFKIAESNELVEILKGDLYHDTKKNTYHVMYNGKRGKDPIHKFFVDKMIEASEKTLDPKPWLIFWVRLMRNPLYKNDSHKVNVLINYLSAQYTNKNAAEKLMEEDGFGEEVATKLSTYDQISITEQGILAAFKYVALITDKYEVATDEESGKQIIKKTERYKTSMKINDVTGEVLEENLDLPEYAEDIIFAPPVMRQDGDAFSCRSLDEDSGVNPGHNIRVGMVHELTGFEQVNTNDSSFGVKGLHLGGYYYVKGYSGRTNYLVDCLISPEDIGAVCDTNDWSNSEGAIRCKRYMVIGAHEHINKGMYHPSAYATLIDADWDTAKAEAIAGLEKAIKDTEAQL